MYALECFLETEFLELHNLFPKMALQMALPINLCIGCTKMSCKLCSLASCGYSTEGNCSCWYLWVKQTSALLSHRYLKIWNKHPSSNNSRRANRSMPWGHESLRSVGTATKYWNEMKMLEVCGCLWKITQLQLHSSRALGSGKYSWSARRLQS